MSKPKSGKNFQYIVSKRYDGMMGRCYRKTDCSYKNYGKRGIRVAGQWIENIVNFKLWMTEEITRLGMTIGEFVDRSSEFHLDRIDVNGHYTPENCRLVSPQVNARNRRIVRHKTIMSAEGGTYEFGN